MYCGSDHYVLPHLFTNYHQESASEYNILPAGTVTVYQRRVAVRQIVSTLSARMSVERERERD